MGGNIVSQRVSGLSAVIHIKYKFSYLCTDPFNLVASGSKMFASVTAMQNNGIAVAGQLKCY